MSQRIVTECDECNALGETRNASTYGVRALSVEVEVDLCDVHIKPLADLLARLVEVGRTPGAATGEAVCPRCGRRFGTAQALGRHAKKAHGETVREARAAIAAESVVEVACPECGKVFPNTRGLGAHRFRTHGVRGSSRDAVRRRASG